MSAPGIGFGKDPAPSAFHSGLGYAAGGDALRVSVRPEPSQSGLQRGIGVAAARTQSTQVLADALRRPAAAESDTALPAGKALNRLVRVQLEQLLHRTDSGHAVVDQYRFPFAHRLASSANRVSVSPDNASNPGPGLSVLSASSRAGAEPAGRLSR